jgi:hypothetical protein
MEKIFSPDILSLRIKSDNVEKMTVTRLNNIKTKHNITLDNTNPEALSSEIIFKGGITWQKILPRMDNLSFTSLYNFTESNKNKISKILEDPLRMFESIKSVTHFFNCQREITFARDQKILRKFMGKIKVSSRGLLSKEIEKDHSKMLYQRFNRENNNSSNNFRLSNLVKPTGPQNSRDMKKYIMSIVNGEVGSDYEEESNLQNIFGNESHVLQLTLDKETQEIVDKLKDKEIKLMELINMDMKKIPTDELKKYEKWKISSSNLVEILEGRIRSNKYLEKEFIEGNCIQPAINCLVRKLKHPSLKFKPGLLTKIEFALLKKKKLGQLLTKFMDEEILLENLFKKFERFYIKFRKKIEKGSTGEKKKKKVKLVEQKFKENVLDDICQDIGFVKEPMEQYISKPEDTSQDYQIDANSKRLSGDILKLNIFQTSKLALVIEENQNSNQISTKCDYFFTGDARVLKLFKGIKHYPRLRTKIRKKISSLENSLISNPLYPGINREPLPNQDNQIYGLTETEFREKCLNSTEFLISGWTIIKDEVFSKKLDQALECGKAIGHVFSANFVFYLTKPNFNDSSMNVAKELWEKWGVRPSPVSQMNYGNFDPIDFNQLFVFCLKRKIGVNKNEKNLSSDEIKKLKSKLVDKILDKSSELSPIKDEIDSPNFNKRSQYSYYCEVKPEEDEIAFSALENMIKNYQQKPIINQPIAFTTLPTPNLPLDFQPTPDYLGKRDNDILGAVKEVPENILKGLIGRPQNVQEIQLPEIKPEVGNRDVIISHPQHSDLGDEVSINKTDQVKEHESKEKSNADYTSLLEIVKNVSSTDLKDIYMKLEDPDMKEMLFKAVQKYYPRENNPLLK